MIKKHKNRNEYYYAGHGLWARNFTKKMVKEIDLNNLVPESDMKLMMENEAANHVKMLQQVDTEGFKHEKIAIVDSGYDFYNNQETLLSLPDDVKVIGVHDTLNHWNVNKKMHYYVINNPYNDAVNYLPKQQKVWPKCIASMRTNPEFIERYNGMKYAYTPTSNNFYSGISSEADYFIDDYRNAVCAAIGLSHKFGVKKLMLLWVDNVFDKQRAGSTQLFNGFWTYPQQMVAHNLIDANLYWLKNSGVEINYDSKGPKYKNATHINKADEFFGGDI